MNNKAGKSGIDPSSQYHAEAVLAADIAVKAVNPDFNPSSRSDYLRNKGMVRLVNMFSSAVVLFAQRREYNALALKQALHKARQDGHGKAEAWGKYARYEMYDFALPGIAMGILLALARGEDDFEGWAKTMGKAYMDTALMRVPFIGNIVGGLIEGETWLSAGTVFDVPVNIGKRLRAAGTDEEKWAWALADAISFWTRVPLSRVARSGVRGYDQWQRGDGTPLSVLMPRPGK